MKAVKDVLQTKGHEVHTISPDAKPSEALQLMAEKNIGSLVVMEAGRMVGVISERDYARKVIVQDRGPKEILVKEIMTPEVLVIRPEHTVEECMALMTAKRIRHLPVFEGDQLVGVISIGDVVKSIVEDREITIEHLTKYITGKYPA